VGSVGKAWVREAASWAVAGREQDELLETFTAESFRQKNRRMVANRTAFRKQQLKQASCFTA